jgi:energy-coupling factor transporter transmembrane protein EcfT
LGEHLHPGTKIICLLAAAAIVRFASPAWLAAMALVAMAMVLCLRANHFGSLLRKMRWLLMFLLVIYAFNTPGEYLRHWSFGLAPTYEGLHAGLLQAVRIIIMLAGVSILLETTERDHLIAGFYMLLYPLKWVGINPERLAVRLWLTLHYVETAPPAGSVVGFLESLDSVQGDMVAGSAPAVISFDLPGLAWRDAVALIVVVFLGVYLV